MSGKWRRSRREWGRVEERRTYGRPDGSWEKLGVATLVAGAEVTAYLAAERWAAHGELPEGLIQVNGYIEGDHITVSSKYAGICTVSIREGETEAANQPF